MKFSARGSAEHASGGAAAGRSEGDPKWTKSTEGYGPSGARERAQCSEHGWQRSVSPPEGATPWFGLACGVNEDGGAAERQRT